MTTEPIYLHCRNCIDDCPVGESPAQWARLNVFLEQPGGDRITVECTRCEMEVGSFALASKVEVKCAKCEEGAPHVH